MTGAVEILSPVRDDWKQRLRSAIDATGKSDRALSMAAGKAPGYIHSIFVEDKDPSISNLIALCDVIGVSLSQVLYGVEISPETEEILALLEASPESRAAILALLRGRSIA